MSIIDKVLDIQEKLADCWNNMDKRGIPTWLRVVVEAANKAADTYRDSL